MFVFLCAPKTGFLSFIFSIFLMFRFILDIDADAGGGEDASTDEEDPEDVDVVDNSRGLVLFVSDYAKERLLMSADWMGLSRQ